MAPPSTPFARDTIVAVATPMGAGALGVVRVSGPAALDVVAPLLRSPIALRTRPSHTVRRVTLIDPARAEVLDEALCAVMRAPRSYTGEDVVELSCHGSPALLRAVVALVVDQGARLAEPGEFTRRAYLNGRLDLAQAEAVALLIGARTQRAVALAARALAGGLSEPMRAVRDALVDLIAGLEVTLDFPEEDVGLDTADAIARVTALRAAVERQLGSARHGRVVHDGLTVALVGPPNAGKSSLLNALLGRERAIVSPVAGTTRDVVEATVALAGVPVRLLDTAGLGMPRDPIEAEGMRHTALAMDEADLLIVVLDGSLRPDAAALERTAGRQRIIVLAKSDLPAHPDLAEHPGVHPRSADLEEGLAVSSMTGAGVDALLKRVTDEVETRAALEGDEGGIVASLRQLDVLGALVASLSSAERALGAAPLELALVDLREALGHVAQLLGTQVADAVLDRIFSTFCLGK
jgi:tRNA modification GTPase